MAKARSRNLEAADQAQLKERYEDGTPKPEILHWLTTLGYSHVWGRIKAVACEQGWTRGVVIPPAAALRHRGPPRINENALCLLDLHIPHHDAAFVTKLCELAEAWGVKTAILDSDAIDLSWLSTFERTGGATPAEELKRWHEVSDALCEHFDRIVVHMGNHGLRVDRTLRRASPEIRELLDVTIGDPIESLYMHRQEIELTHFSYCFVQGILVGHPAATGRDTAIYIAEAHECDVVVGHTHYRSRQWTRSGKHVAIETGMAADPRRLWYVTGRLPARARGGQRQGAAIIMKGDDGRARIYGPLTPDEDWAAWKRMYAA